MKRRWGAVLTAGTMCLSLCGSMMPAGSGIAVSAAEQNCVEYLDRGISAVNTGSGMLVSWRFLANDPDNGEYRLYRDDNLIYTSKAGEGTSYLDAGGSAASAYKVECYDGTRLISSDMCSLRSSNSYFEIPMDQPTGSGCTYSPNDCTVGDADGDGVYELFVKWDPSNSQDNSKSGKTGNVYIDCYKLDGTKLWRVDLGVNIRAGAHYTQMLVADFDLDGKCEMTCKTADGTVDGTGRIIGDGSKDYRNSKGYILTGNEYYTLFDGATGAALDTVDYNPPRGDVSKWGDKYGNRVDRFLGAVAYLDGVKPSAVTIRGYYTRMTACAYDVVDKRLVQRWYFDSGNSSSADGYGDGNHNCMPADVDGDGKQEIILGATCLDDDGTVKWCLNTGHGDAMHLGDLLPERAGLELWICHEDKPYGVSLVDAASGQVLFHKDGAQDTGRCCADNVWAGNDGAEFWGLGNDVFNGSGNTLSCRRPAINFLSYWDGDLEREILDGYTDSPATISKMKDDGTLTPLLSTDGYYTCNTTKGTPCLSADIFGDWREELIVRAANGKSVRIYCTTYDSDYRITTLMQDPQYRNQVAGQNISYNQPPHTSFYLGSDQPLPARPQVQVNGKTSGKPGAVIDTQHTYSIRNAGSGLYLEAAEGAAANGTNVQQGTFAQNGWHLTEAGDGYYCLHSEIGDGSYLLDIDYGKTDNGTNIGIWQNTNSDAQLFKFVDNGDGTYTITTKVTKDGSCLGVESDSKETGANVVEWECNGKDSQKWILEIKVDPIDGELFRNLIVKDTATYSAWKYDDAIAVGEPMFGDREFVYTELPADLVGGEAILTACDAKFTEGDLADFTAASDIDIYVGMDSRVDPLPEWLSTWTASDMTAVASNDVTFVFYKKSVAAGESITLGENGQSAYCVNYTVVIKEKEMETLPTDAPTDAPTEVLTNPPSVLYGDADESGEVDIGDVIALCKASMGSYALTAKGFLNGDVDLDGEATTTDATYILQSLIGLETLPIQ